MVSSDAIAPRFCYKSPQPEVENVLPSSAEKRQGAEVTLMEWYKGPILRYTFAPP